MKRKIDLMTDGQLSKKTNIALQIILVFFFLILFRIWYLAVIQKETIAKTAIPSSQKTVIEHAMRGIIKDRYGTVLAANRIRYNATIYYNHIRQIPSIKWALDSFGVKRKILMRKTHIETLAVLLAKELDMDPTYIEDQIHAKASILPNTPFVIKENITEKQYYRLKILEKDYLGLHAEAISERYYPHGKLAADIIGYLGRINQKEYFSIASEIKKLEIFGQSVEADRPLFLPEGYGSCDEALTRLQELKDHSYRINDLIGKCGIEKQFEEALRGRYGEKIYKVNPQSNLANPLQVSKPAISGQTINLTISSELQQFCEELLIKDEILRDGESSQYDAKLKQRVEQKQPWIKGGAIIAIDPLTAEIVACASYPRFNPNDFIPSMHPEMHTHKLKKCNLWLETPQHIANVWDNSSALYREKYDAKQNKVVEEQQYLTWEFLLSELFGNHSSLLNSIDTIRTIKQAIDLQELAVELKFLFKTDDLQLVFDWLFPSREGHITRTSAGQLAVMKESFDQVLMQHTEDIFRIKTQLLHLLSSVQSNIDKLFIIDLCRTIVYSPAFSDELIEQLGHMPLKTYWQTTKDMIFLEGHIKSLLAPQFRNTHFATWRKEHQKTYIQKKRLQEKKQNRFAKPYTDYLYQKEQKLFHKHWQTYKGEILSALIFDKKQDAYQTVLQMTGLSCQPILQRQKHLFQNISDDTLVAFLRTIRRFEELERPLLTHYPAIKNKPCIEKSFAALFYPRYGFGYSRSNVYQEGTALGSIFKIFTAYAALKQRYVELNLRAQSINPYSLNPFEMVDRIELDPHSPIKGSIIVGYDILSNKPYPRFYKGGRLPKSSNRNMGKINLATAMERSSNPYFALLTTEVLKDGNDLLTAAQNFGFGKKTGIDLPAEYFGTLPKDLKTNKTGLYSFAIGQHTLSATALQTALALSSLVNGGYLLKPKLIKSEPTIVQNTLFMPGSIRDTLMQSLYRVINGTNGTARAMIIKKLVGEPALRKAYIQTGQHMVGKTSTAEFMYKSVLAPSCNAEKYKNVWFGAIAFKEDEQIHSLDTIATKKWENPELVVVVFLKFGSGGKEAAPIATQVIDKFREITKKYQ